MAIRTWMSFFTLCCTTAQPTRHYTKISGLAGRIFFDLLNEPDGFNMTWSYANINTRGLYPNSSTVPAWGDLFTDTADSLVAQEPDLLLLAEGTGQFNQPGTAYGNFLKHVAKSAVIATMLLIDGAPARTFACCLCQTHKQRCSVFSCPENI